LHSKGRIAITGTLDADLAYVRTWPTPTGGRIRGVTNRPIRFRKAYYDARSMDYSMTAFEPDSSDEKGKSTGTLIPACQIRIDKETNQMEIEAPASDAEGVIVAQGANIGGWSLYAKSGKLKYCYNGVMTANPSLVAAWASLSSRVTNSNPRVLSSTATSAAASCNASAAESGWMASRRAARSRTPS
jgi:hypothetical protein